MSETKFIFGRKNYILFFAGLALILLGFALMTGGGSEDPEVYNPELFNFQRIGLAPILIVGGLVVEVFAILHRPKA